MKLKLNVYDGIWENKELLDFSKYSKYPKFHDKTKRIVFSKMTKNDVPITEFVGLTQKIYSLIKNECRSLISKCDK